jgi:hypothetical protein
MAEAELLGVFGEDGTALVEGYRITPSPELDNAIHTLGQCFPFNGDPSADEVSAREYGQAAHRAIIASGVIPLIRREFEESAVADVKIDAVAVGAGGAMIVSTTEKPVDGEMRVLDNTELQDEIDKITGPNSHTIRPSKLIN